MKVFRKISSTGRHEQKLIRTGGWALLFLCLLILVILIARVAGLIAGPAPAWYLWAVAAAGLAFSVTQILGLGWTLSFPLPLAVGLLAGVEAAHAATVLSTPPQNETPLVNAQLEQAVQPHPVILTQHGQSEGQQVQLQQIHIPTDHIRCDTGIADPGQLIAASFDVLDTGLLERVTKLRLGTRHRQHCGGLIAFGPAAADLHLEDLLIQGSSLPLSVPLFEFHNWQDPPQEHPSLPCFRSPWPAAGRG